MSFVDNQRNISIEEMEALRGTVATLTRLIRLTKGTIERLYLEETRNRLNVIELTYLPFLKETGYDATLR